MITRTQSLLVALALALAVIAQASVVSATPSGGCPKFTPALSDSESGQHEEAADTKVIALPSAATEENPLTVQYQHELGLDPGYDFDQIVGEATFFNFQMQSAKPATMFNVRVEWAAPSPYDIELFLYDQLGEQIAFSASLNPAADVHRSVFPANDDGDGWEQILEIPVKRCAGLTVESQGGITLPLDAVLKVWLT